MKEVNKVLLLGSGGIRISQAGEFDYSGSQAIKALKEEGIKVILLNPNIATIQTDQDMADEVYFEPLDFAHTTRIIDKEKPDAILLSFGGQTALNLGIELSDKGILKKYEVKVLGISIETIKLAENRGLFKSKLDEICITTAKSFVANTVEEAILASDKLGFPLMIRSGFSLGGLGSGIIYNKDSLKDNVAKALHGACHVLIEESLLGWHEFEYEVIRDSSGNALTICNMENLDPMGVHTGDSIVISPSQSLNNKEYHRLRQISINIAHHFDIVGECNIQYAFNLKTSEYRVIEINPRLSRSSALASKATGYPLAFIATKLLLGYNLYELPNTVTKKTCAYFEPALDYVVLKIPRWDINKLRKAHRRIGTEMKSVGEVMAIGRSFAESLQKAVSMLNIGAYDLSSYPFEIPDLINEIKYPTDRRIFAIYKAFMNGYSINYIASLCHINKWFLYHLHCIAHLELLLKKYENRFSKYYVILAKKFGFSDNSIANFFNIKSCAFRKWRIKQGIVPYVKQIDTLAGEFEAYTNYLYMTYHGIEHDILPSQFPSNLIIGSGPYSIGSSVEFDWCAVTTAHALRDVNEHTIIVNSNPETVSTDYDESDRLYFESLTFERIQDIADFENLKGIIVSVGGQVANNLSIPLYNAGYPILGTLPENIHIAENRALFSQMLNDLNIDQPRWQSVTTLNNAKLFANNVKYPILVRPSYVLSGSSMNIIYSDNELYKCLKEAYLCSPKYPVVISEFISFAKELEIDGVAENGMLIIYAISEHIENAGVHSGDATIVFPPQNLCFKIKRRVKQIAKKIIYSLKISGPFNIQFILKDNNIKVIECNLRASRSFPFISKLTGYNFIAIATQVIIKKYKKMIYNTLDLDYVGVKTAQFSFNRLKGSNPVAHVEMSSTGEVACIGYNLLDAFYKSWQSTSMFIRRKKVLLSINDNNKSKLFHLIKHLSNLNWDIYTTIGTYNYLYKLGVNTYAVYKVSECKVPNVEEIINYHKVDLIINISQCSQRVNNDNISDGFKIRRLAVDHHIPLVTNLQISELILRSCIEIYDIPISIRPWSEFVVSKS